MTSDPAAPTSRPRSPLRRRILFALGVLVGSLGLAEGVLRATLPVARRATLPNDMIQAHLEGAAFVYDPDLFWYWPDPLGSGSPVNEHGFVRTKPMTIEKPAGVTRVVTFGDSQTFGAGMPADRTYSAFAEAALGEGWEVLNAGLSGYRTLNVYRLLRLRVAAFQPDAVVIDCMPYDSPRDDGTLEGTPLRSSRWDSARRLLWQSRLYYVLRLGLEVLNPNRARWLDDTHPHGRPGEEKPPGNHDLIAAWGAEHGVEVFFMEYPIMTEGGQHGCMTNPGELPPGGRVIPTCQRLAASGRPAPMLFQDRNHLTSEGNQLVGEIVADAIREWSRAR